MCKFTVEDLLNGQLRLSTLCKKSYIITLPPDINKVINLIEIKDNNLSYIGAKETDDGTVTEIRKIDIKFLIIDCEDSGCFNSLDGSKLLLKRNKG